MSFKSRIADHLTTQLPSVSPVIAGIRAARTPAWQARNDRDDLHLRVILAATLGMSSNVIDVGAANGTVLDDVVRYAPQGRHVAFEPRRDAAAALAGRFPNVTVRQTAASDVAGSAPFTLVRNIPELSGMKPRAWPHHELVTDYCTVTTERLDDVIGHPVHLLKIDVEGAEAACLRGARRLLEEFRPLTIFEHGATTSTDPASPDHGDIWGILDEAGMRIFSIDGDGPLSSDMFSALSSSGNIWSFVARSM